MAARTLRSSATHLESCPTRACSSLSESAIPNIDLVKVVGNAAPKPWVWNPASLATCSS